MPTVESFEATPYRYWLKEYTEGKMKLEVRNVLCRMEKNRKENPDVLVKKGNLDVKLSAEEICYVAIAKKGTTFHTSEKGSGIYTSHRKLAEVYEQLKDFGFVYAYLKNSVSKRKFALSRRTVPPTKRTNSLRRQEKRGWRS